MAKVKDDKSAAAKTNAAKSTPKNDDDDDAVDADVPTVDITLDETKRILIDYIGLLNNGNGVVSTSPGSKRQPQ